MTWLQLFRSGQIELLRRDIKHKHTLKTHDRLLTKVYSKGLWSIWINGQWRICFTGENEVPCRVEIVDSH